MIRFKKDEVVLDGRSVLESKVPNNYTPTEYLFNTAADTKFETNAIINQADFEIQLKIQPSTGSWYIIQARYPQNSNIFGLTGSVTRNTIAFYFNSSKYVTSSITRDTSHTYFIKASLKNNIGTLYVYDITANVEDTKTIEVNDFVPNTQPLNIFGNQLNQYVQARNYLYFVKVWQCGELILDVVPVYENANRYLFDLVSNNVLSGGGSINIGPTVSAPTPDYAFNIKCNNGVIKYNNGVVYAEGVPEVVKDRFNNTAIAQMLFGSTLVYDYQDVNSGRVLRNINVYAFTGQESWSYSSEYGCFVMSPHIPSMYRPWYMLCNMFDDVPYDTSNEGIGFYDSQFFIRYNDFNNDVLKLKEFLSDRYQKNEPVIILYQLETPIEQYTTPQPLDIEEVTQISGSIDDMPIHTAPTTVLKHRYFIDNLGQRREVKKVYQGSYQIYP